MKTGDFLIELKIDNVFFGILFSGNVGTRLQIHNMYNRLSYQRAAASIHSQRAVRIFMRIDPYLHT